MSANLQPKTGKLDTVEPINLRTSVSAAITSLHIPMVRKAFVRNAVLRRFGGWIGCMLTAAMTQGHLQVVVNVLMPKKQQWSGLRN